MRLVFTIDFIAGTSITQACEEARRVARLLDANVRFNFNGVEMFMTPDSDAAEKTYQYLNVINPVRKEGT